jgi:putative nucleotidyltransferase with HDIG domain
MKDMERVLSEVEKLPPMPQVVQRLAAMLRDPEVSAAQLVGTVQLDQALTANVLRICNSAYFGARRQVNSLQQALALIGNDRLLDIVMSQGSSAYFARASKGYELARGELWRHSVAAALASQILCRRLSGRGDPMLYTAALLHDIGKVVLSEFVAEGFQAIQALVRERRVSFGEAEREVLGIDHAELGARMCERWDFPPQLVAAIANHHNPEAAQSDPLSALVYVSDLICLLLGIGAGADGLAYHGGDELMATLKMTEVDIHLTMADLADELQRAEEMLQV